MTDEGDNPVVSLAIGLAALGLAVVVLMALRSTPPTKIALRGAQGPTRASHDEGSGVCVGPECEIPGAPGR